MPIIAAPDHDDAPAHASDNDEAIDARAHKRLLDGVSRLNKTQFIKRPTRDEPALKRDEFHLVKPNYADSELLSTAEREAAKQATVSMGDLLRVLSQSGEHAGVSRQLRKLSNKKTTLEKPLERTVSDRISRTVSYERTKKKLNRWNALVTRNRAADHLQFPLEANDKSAEVYDGTAPSQGRFKLQPALERELQALDAPEVYVQGANEPDEEDEQLQEQRLTRAEMLERSKELRLLRVRESQRSAKARMQNKIKSKKFHKILKKEKLKEQLKEFEALQKQDPEAAMRKLEQLEKHRVEERALLRHKNTGTWAKNLQVRAKYDKDVRKELSEQLAISRELTAKHTATDDTDDEAGADVAVTELTEGDPFNPWLKKGASAADEAAAEEADAVGGYRKYWEERNANEQAVRAWRSQDAPIDDRNREPAAPLKPTPKKAPKKAAGKAVRVAGWAVEDCDESTGGDRQKAEPSDADGLDDMFDDAEDVLLAKVETKFKAVSAMLEKDDDADDDEALLMSRSKRKRAARKGNSGDLSFKKQAKRPQLDEQLDHHDSNDDDGDAADEAARKAIEALRSMSDLKPKVPGSETTAGDINPNTFMRVSTKHLQTALPDFEGGHDASDDESGRTNAKRLTIAEAFEDDDIVADFEQERDDERRKNEPEDVNLTLPGWGSWGGSGIDPSKQRVKKLILKFPKQEPRKDENKGHVIIVDNDNRKLRDHQVSKLPFPFTSVSDYEASIRAPIGRDFVTPIAHELLTKPAIETKLGTIIAPIHEDMLLKRTPKARTKTDKRIAAMAREKAAAKAK